MAAVFLYVLPSASKNPSVKWLRKNYTKSVRPYMLVTSQWQQWNLFAPDPLRRVTHYIIDQEDPTTFTGWSTLIRYQPGSFPWYRHASNFKVLDRIFDYKDRKRPLQERYIQTSWEKFNLPPGTKLRMRYLYYVIPKKKEILKTSFWQEWEPTWNEKVGITTRCTS